MKNSYFLLILLSVIVIILHNLKPEDVNYPNSKKQLIVDSYFDTTIVDPYRWLEDESSRETKSSHPACLRHTDRCFSKHTP